MSKIESSSSRVPRSSGARAPKVQPKADERAHGSEPPVQSPISPEDQLLFNTIPNLAVPNIDQQVLVGILKKLGVDFLQSALSGEVSTIKFDQERLQTLAKDNQKKLAHMLKKIEKRKKAGLLGKIFSWIGAALGTILGSVFAVLSFGSGSVVAGMLISASVALTISLAAASSTGGMEKLVDALAKGFSKMFEAFGMDAKQAKRISKIVAEVVIAIIVIAAQIVIAVFSGGASLESTVSTLANKIMSLSVKAASVALGLVALAGAGTQTASGVYNFEATRDQADMTENKAFLQKMHALIAMEQDMIQELIRDMMSTQKNMNQLIKDENKTRGILADIDAQPSAV